ncbi:putative HET domain-containing protein [Seiridium unicorne]|uniref:HET domain-containing protein n=1 Tax=Seiridium unicorne TaxID=138068 RepID=A0ABR2ULH3_9PEZI
MTESNNHKLYGDLTLGQNEFRLLNLAPARDTIAPIVLQLINCDLNSDQWTYDAISHRWEDSNNRCKITANGFSCSVTKSLGTALKYMRQESSERTLWIDGVCIDQDNVVERNNQVLKMGTIFSKAQNVRMWLGESAEHSDAAMKLMARLPLHDIYQADSELVDTVLNDPVGGVALTKLLRRSYWQRMWILQEILLARNAVVHCGHLKAPWAHFKALDRVSADQRLWLSSQIREGWVWELRRAFFGIAQCCMTTAEAWSISNVLEPTRRLKSTDPRDKLYALIGLCGSAMGLTPDYSRTTCEVYAEFTRNHIVKDGNMSLLLTAGLWNSLNGPDIGLPSWVPDFRGLHGVDIRYVAANYLKHFNASLQENNAVATFPSHGDKSSRKCSLRGLLIDEVSKVLPLEKGEECRANVLATFEPPPTAPHCSRGHQLQKLFRISIFDDPTLHDGPTELMRQRAHERFARLILGFAQDYFTVRSRHGTAATYRKAVELLESFETTGNSLRHQFDKLTLDDPEALHWYREEYLIRSEETIDGTPSCMFSTVEDYIGKGPSNMVNGDWIAILYGCRLPVVLRPFWSYYRLVGPCYVDGLMNGEAIPRHEDLAAGFKDEEIVIV